MSLILRSTHKLRSQHRYRGGRQGTGPQPTTTQYAAMIGHRVATMEHSYPQIPIFNTS